MKLLQTQDQLNELIDSFSDEHCFVRECHLISPSYIKGESLATVAADSLPGVRILISCPSRESSGLELVLYDLEYFRMDFGLPFVMQGRVVPDKVQLSFSRSEDSLIVGKLCYYKVLGIDSLGAELKFGYESIYDDGGFPSL